MNQLEAQYQEILHILDKLLANLGLMLEDYDVEYLTQADLYIEIFKVMFPVLEPVLNAGFGEDVTDEELIQYLINVLAKDIIKMDLGHISGELIAQGDAKNILNFLQLLFEISNMVVEGDSGSKKSKRSKKRKDKNKKLVKSSGNSVDQDSSNNTQRSSIDMGQKYNSVQGINAEFSNSSATGESAPQTDRESGIEEIGYNGEVHNGLKGAQMVYDQQRNIMTLNTHSRSVSRISEVSKSKESSEYDRGVKKLSQKFDDFNPTMLQVKNLVAEGNKGSYTSDDLRQLRKNHAEEEEEEEEEDQEELEEVEGTENEYGSQQESGHAPGYTEEQEEEGEHGHEEHQYEEEEDGEEHHHYVDKREYFQDENEEDDIIEEDGDELSEQHRRMINNHQGGDDVEYYSSDPINYHPVDKMGAQHAHAERDNQAIGKRHQATEEDYEEEEHDEHGEEMYVNEEYHQEGQEIAGRHEEMDPRYMEYMQEVVEEEQNEEESYDSKNQEAHYPQELHQAGHAPQAVAKKPKNKNKTKKTTKKKSTKKAVEDYNKGKVQYRPLKPQTAGMKRPATAGAKRPQTATKKGNVNRSTSSKGSETKSKRSSTSSSKRLMHSKSERKLEKDEEQEPSQSQSGMYEEYSEEKGMDPKGYSRNEKSQIPSQHGHYSEIQEEQEGQGEQEEHEEQEYQNEMEQNTDGNVFKILSDNVIRVKENLRENCAIEDVPFDDQNTVKMIRQQKDQYKQYLKDFMKDQQTRERNGQKVLELSQKNFHKKLRSERIRDEKIKQEFENQQKSLYFKMRDQKVNYLRRIHKTIFELEKKRIIEEKKEYIEFRKAKNEETCNMIESIKNDYKNRLSLLRESTKSQQNERKIASDAQRTFLKTLENELKMDQLKEMERLKNKCRLEKERFELMIRDDGFLEQKVMQLYKKGTF